MPHETNHQCVCYDCMLNRAKASYTHPTMHKIRVRIPKEAGWDTEAEWFWAEKVGDKVYELRNIPFYAYGLSMGDLVNVDFSADGGLEFVNVVTPGGHSTYRVIARQGLDTPEVQQQFAKLVQFGCETEQVSRFHVAIDVPITADINAVYDVLQNAESTGVWEFEEGHCGHNIGK